MKSNYLTISVVSQQTGITKEVLRKWETRYGFPLPNRDAAGQRLYPAEQTTRLQLIKRLLDDGMRPGQVVPLEKAGLMTLLTNRKTATAYPPKSDFTKSVVQLMQAHDPGLLKEQLQSELAQRGLRDFILHVMPALNAAVGNSWASGDISIKDEHLYTETVRALVTQGLPRHARSPGSPRILLTTLTGELHTLGILMIEALMTLEGATCISLGAQTPLAEIASASQAFQADIVGLSFSVAFARKKILPALRELRSLCPGEIEVWAGGSGVARMDSTPRGVFLVPTLMDAFKALQSYQRRRLDRAAAYG